MKLSQIYFSLFDFDRQSILICFSLSEVIVVYKTIEYYEMISVALNINAPDSNQSCIEYMITIIKKRLMFVFHYDNIFFINIVYNKSNLLATYP